MIEVPQPNFDHLVALTGPYGTYEHADRTNPRVEHGYCTDDVARVLLVLERERDLSPVLSDLATSSLEFLALAQSSDGRFRNRRLASGEWRGPTSAEDCWGRAVWALGTTIARSNDSVRRTQAMAIFERAATVRSPWPRSMAWAALGAVEVLRVDGDHRGAHELVDASVPLLSRREYGDDWRWPERRLTYANPVLAEALIAVGAHVRDHDLFEAGLRRLHWLLAMETRDSHLSVTPVGGRGQRDGAGQFDQQPIEVASMADACVHAFELTGDVSWIDGIVRSVNWFLGDNDGGAVMYDVESGGGYDGLTATGPNVNQGAESTIAFLTTMQHARRFALSHS